MLTAIPPLKESELIEFGNIEPGRGAETDVSKIVVASYNIRYAVGRFLISGGIMRKLRLRRRRRRALQVGRHIQTAVRAFSENKLLPRVDVLAVQEADKQTGRTGGHHVARELAEGLEMSWIHVPAGIPRGQKPMQRQWWLNFEEPIDLFDPGDTGVAMLSRLRLSDVERIDLPWQECAWRPRLAMAATVVAGQHSLRVINAHVDPHAQVGGQLKQLEVLVERAKSFTGPTLILGDFNTLSKRKVDETYAFMESHGYSTPFPKGIATWRGAGLRMDADWIFYRGVEISRWGVARPLNVSDHWPVWVEIAFPPILLGRPDKLSDENNQPRQFPAPPDA